MNSFNSPLLASIWHAALIGLALYFVAMLLYQLVNFLALSRSSKISVNERAIANALYRSPWHHALVRTLFAAYWLSGVSFMAAGVYALW